MAHHFEIPEGGEESRLAKELRQLMAGEAKSLGLGATRAFPQGVVNDLDEGEIQFAVKGDEAREKVFINFGKSVDVVGMTPQQAIDLAQCLIKHARAVAKTPVSIVLH
jgi:hypothetical protein